MEQLPSDITRTVLSGQALYYQQSPITRNFQVSCHPSGHHSITGHVVGLHLQFVTLLSDDN